VLARGSWPGSQLDVTLPAVPVRAGRAVPRWPEFAASVGQGLRYLLSVRILLVLTAVQIVVNLCLSVEKPIILRCPGTRSA
jgi:hypothetical protein